MKHSVKHLMALATLGLAFATGCELTDGLDASIPDAAVEASSVAGVWKISGSFDRSNCLDTQYNSGNVALNIAPFEVAQHAQPAGDGGVNDTATLSAMGLPATVQFTRGRVDGLNVSFALAEMAGRDEISMTFEGRIDGLGDLRGQISEGFGPREGCTFEGTFFIDIE